MSDSISNLVVEGFAEQLEAARKLLDELRVSPAASREITFGDTNYNLPLYFGLTGKKISSLKDVESVIAEYGARGRRVDASKLELAGVASLGLDVLVLQELCKVMEYSLGRPVGFIPDTVLRSLGVQLVSGDIVGIAVIIGPAKDQSEAVSLVRSLQEKNILVVLCGSHEGRDMKAQLEAAGVEMALDTYIVWLGDDTESTVLALNWAIRAALTFGGLEGGQRTECLEYCAKRVPAFAIALSGVDAKKVATAAGAIGMGFPVIVGLKVPEITVTDGPDERRLLVSCPDVSRIVDTAIDVRHIKVKTATIPIPVRYGPAFEGERVRKEDLAVEFGAKGTTALELVVMEDPAKIGNRRITVTGRDSDVVKDGESLDLAILVKVAGGKMQKDFEPILERQIHHFINCAMGIMHMGQRNLVRIRISRKARDQGFAFRHLGEILCAKLMSEYGMIIDKLEVEIITETSLVMQWAGRAKTIYRERDLRIGAMTDESVDVFYSCTLCQSFAPNHVCIITPERVGLCGAYNWLDGKAAHQIMPTGPNQPVPKGRHLDPKLGQWEGVNGFIHAASNKTLDRFSAYSLMVDPMTSCGCFECIVTVLPGTGGFMIVDRSFSGMTPCGMTFSTLAGIVGGGRQSPGFIGIGANYIVSRKFLSAEDGVKRLVWMPSALKERLKDGLKERVKEAGVPKLLDMIADETVATEMAGLVEFLTGRKHPALEMGDLI
jgi:acetyl-CoA synthase